MLERCNRLASAEIAAARSSTHVDSPFRRGMEKLSLDFSPGSWMVAAAAWRESDRSEWPFAAALGLLHLPVFERSANPQRSGPQRGAEVANRCVELDREGALYFS